MNGKKVLLALLVVALIIGCGSSSSTDSKDSQAGTTETQDNIATRAVATGGGTYQRVLAAGETYPSYYTNMEKIVLKDAMSRYFDVSDKGVLSYGLSDAARAQGNVCPAVTGSFLMTREALKYLVNEYKNEPRVDGITSYDYDDGIMNRGGIKILMSGKDNSGGANNAMANVMSYITGAKGADGFAKGPNFPFANRQNLLAYDANLTFDPSDKGIQAIFTTMKATYVKVDDNGTQTPATFEECKGTWGVCKEKTTCDKSVKVTYKFIGGDQEYERTNLRIKYIVDHYENTLTLESVENPAQLCAAN